MFQVILHYCILLRDEFSLSLHFPVVCCSLKRFWLRISNVFIEFPCILINVIQSDCLSINSYILIKSEVFWYDKLSTIICSQNFLSFQECTLWDSTIFLFWFSYGYWMILQVVEDSHFSHSEILKCWFNNWLLEKSTKSQNMSIHLHPGWLVQLFRVITHIFWKMHRVCCAHVIWMKHSCLRWNL